MSEIKRWDLEFLGDSMRAALIREPDGKWVTYDDHAAIIAEKDAEIARLKEENLTLAAQAAKMREAMEAVRYDHSDWVEADCWLYNALNQEPTATERYVKTAIELYEAATEDKG